MNVNGWHAYQNTGLGPGPLKRPPAAICHNWRGVSHIRLITFLGFMGLAMLIAAPSLVGMVRPKPADAVGWITDLTEAQAVAGRTGKPMILKFTADWCGPCRMLSREVFSDPQIGKFVRGAFVPVIVDVTDHDSPGQSIANQYMVDALPTLIVLGADGREQARKTGYIDKFALRDWLAAYSPAMPAQAHSASIVPPRAGQIAD